MSTAIFYGSSTGNTQSAAEAIGKCLGINDIYDISEGVEKMNGYDKIILGASTWGEGSLQDDWESEWKDFCELNFQGKTVALFGLGDQESYGDNYLDAMGEIYEVIIKKGGNIIGEWSSDGYVHDQSKAEIVSGFFVGLALDEDNESDLTPSRIETWCSQIKDKFL
jgi:flavodoxin I